jgi:hypothetical protein
LSTSLAWIMTTDGRTGGTSAHSASSITGFPFSTTYVASSDALPLPAFRTAWTTPAGTVKASPALHILVGWPSIWYSSDPSRM